MMLPLSARGEVRTTQLCILDYTRKQFPRLALGIQDLIASHRPRLRCGMGAIGLQSGTLAKVGYQISNPCGRLAASQWKKLVYTQHRACGCRPQAEVITLSAFAPLRPLEKLGLFHIS